MIEQKLSPCPFCGLEPRRSGDYCIYCDCGASVEIRNYSFPSDIGRVDQLWNNRSTDLQPIIQKVSKLKGLGSAYIDMCSADFKIKARQ